MRKGLLIKKSIMIIIILTMMISGLMAKDVLVRLSLKNYQEAKSFFSNAITLALEIQSPDELSQALWNMGQAYDSENRFQDAAYYFESAINIMKEIGHKDLQNKIYLFHKYLREKKL